MPRNLSLTSLYLACQLHPERKSVCGQAPIRTRDTRGKIMLNRTTPRPRTASMHERFRAPRHSEARPSTSTGDCLHFAIHTLRLTPDHIQSRILASNARQIILNCHRQWGKSLVASAIAAHTLLTTPDSTVLIVAPSKRQSGELLRRIQNLLETTGHKVQGDGINDLSIELPNGSRAIGLPGTEATTRCFTNVGLLIIDEAARVQDETYKSVRAFVVASRGRILMLSTPYGLRGFFHDEWRAHNPDFERYAVRADENPRFTSTMLEEERRSLGELWFRQEYLCEFITDHEQIFMPDKVRSMISNQTQIYSHEILMGPHWHYSAWGRDV